ncbi:hypothetical protein [Kingella oralis]|uniref:hypothetical protein n=1 Tax=Kingella oralis TaxID=505 RepID=UPI0034E51EA0
MISLTWDLRFVHACQSVFASRQARKLTFRLPLIAWRYFAKAWQTLLLRNVIWQASRVSMPNQRQPESEFTRFCPSKSGNPIFRLPKHLKPRAANYACALS